LLRHSDNTVPQSGADNCHIWLTREMLFLHDITEYRYFNGISIGDENDAGFLNLDDTCSQYQQKVHVTKFHGS